MGTGVIAWSYVSPVGGEPGGGWDFDGAGRTAGEAGGNMTTEKGSGHAKVLWPMPGRDHIQGPADAPIQMIEYGGLSVSVLRGGVSGGEGGAGGIGGAVVFCVSQFSAGLIMRMSMPSTRRRRRRARGRRGSSGKCTMRCLRISRRLEDEDLAGYAAGLGLGWGNGCLRKCSAGPHAGAD